MSASQKIETNSSCAFLRSKSRLNAMALSTKIVLVVVGLIFAVVTPQANAGSIATMERCMSESGASRAMLMDFLQGDNDSREVKCFFRCAMEASGAMNADGSYNMDAMKKMQPPGLYKVASTTCGDFPASDDNCERAYAHIACLRDNAKDDVAKMFH